jgi:thiamine-monophosphate kinase
MAYMPREPEMRRSPEFELIAAIRGRLAAGGSSAQVIGIGDDAAVTVPRGATVTSIDALVEGVHFQRRWSPPAAIGHKALAAALSDLAAMGARAGEAYVWLGRPEDLDREQVLELCDGISACARQAGVAVLGGDLTAAPALALCVTVVGHAARPSDLIGRDGAAAGEVICLTGELGGAAAGLIALQRPEPAAALPEAERQALIERQLWPRPRLAEGAALARSGATAMLDISDGLGADAEQLAAASAVGIEIETARVPLASGVERVAETLVGRDAFELALGGEDYELLCALPRERLQAAVAALSELGCPLTEVGAVGAGRGARLRLPSGAEAAPLGHDHLARGR